MADERIVIDIDDLELGEVEEFEEAMGQTLDEININSAKALIRLVWIVKKRDDPKFTLTKARKLKLSQFGMDGDEPGPPTRANGQSKRAASGRRKSGSASA